jgi:hypothetical protein
MRKILSMHHPGHYLGPCFAGSNSEEKLFLLTSPFIEQWGGLADGNGDSQPIRPGLAGTGDPCGPASVQRRRLNRGTNGFDSTPVDREIEGVTGFVPHTAVIRGQHAEAVAAWRKIVIERLPFIANVLPVGITPFQFDAKTILLRHDQAESGIVYLQIARQRRQVLV